jgi:hypothetical protein
MTFYSSYKALQRKVPTRGSRYCLADYGFIKREDEAGVQLAE